MIRILDVNSFCKNLKPVTSSEYFTKTEEFHPDGLFSEIIFGTLGSVDRRQSFSYIDLKCKVVHPSVFKILTQLDRKIEKFISTEESFSLDSKGNLKVDNEGVTGINEFIKIFPDIKFRGETETRDKYIKLLKKAHSEKLLFVEKVPIIPPDFRPAFQDEEGTWTIDPLNDYYITILRRSFQVRSSSGHGPLFDLLNYGIQTAVINHDNFIRSRIAKKPGIIRKDLLSKRVDFSGRAVITPGPDLGVNQIGIPFRLAAGIFEPFIIHRLLYSDKIDKEKLNELIKDFTGFGLSVDILQKVLKSIKSGDKIPDELYNFLFLETEIAIEGRVVLAKRDPALHAESVRAFSPKLISGNTIQLCTLVVGNFNADYDGDQMAIYHPLTTEAQEEAKLKMTRAQSGNSSKSITFELSKEMYAGLYIMSKTVPLRKSPVSVDNEYLEKVTDPYIPVLYKKTKTTSGRAVINSCFPNSYPFVDEQFSKKLLKKLIDGMFNKYEENEIKETASKLEKVGFKFATIMAPSFSLDNVEIPDEIYHLKEKLKGANTEEADALLKQMEKILVNHLKGTGLYDLIESGAGKGWGQPMQILVSKGIIANPRGEVLEPIKGSFSDGLTNEEFFNASAGARKGIMDRVLNTATTGYMSRKLVFVLNSVEADPYVRDCKTNKTLTLKLTNDLISRLTGRFIVKDNKVIEFEPNEYKEGDVIYLRTPIYCKSPKICHVCYGKLLLRHKSPHVGVLAAQIIGERGTQLIMKCSDGLVHYDNKLFAFEDLWNHFNEITSPNKNSNNKDLELKVSGKNKNVRALKIQKHLPTDKMIFISTKSGHTLICQKNHPLWIKKYPIHDKFINEKCRLIGENSYTEIQSTRKIFKTSNSELKEVEAKDLKEYDAIWIDNSIAINSSNDIIPEINGYLTGIFLAEGNFIWSERQTKGFQISQQDGIIVERIIKESYNFDRFKKYNGYITYWDNEERIKKIIYGRYSYEKRLEPNFINYNSQWLKDFLAGLIDGDGIVFNMGSTCVRIYTSSYYLVQQIKAICIKLGYKMNTCIVPKNKDNCLGCKQKRLNFICDIRFIDYCDINSIKIKNNGEVIPCKLRKEKVIKGFDIITKVKEIWKWEYNVYDLQTETSEYMLGFVQNHNSFHTGGAVEVKKRDLIQDIINNNPLIK